jgi:hypothetical protein
MTETFSTRGLKALFSYPFRQPGWEGKLLMLAGLYLAGFIVPIIPWFFMTGYTAELMRRTVTSEGEPELPRWTNWQELLMDGLRLTGISLLIMIPFALIFICACGPYLTSLITLISSSEGSSRANSGASLFYMLSFFWLMLSMGCSFFLGIGIGIPLPAATVHVVYKRSLGAFFQVKEWWKVFRANLGGFVVAYFLLIATSMTLQMMTQILASSMIFMILVMVVPFVVWPYILVISSLLFGQAYREGLENLDLLKLDQPMTPEEIMDSPAI